MSKETVKWLSENRSDRRAEDDETAMRWLDLMLENLDDLLDYAEASMNSAITPAALGRRGGLKGGAARADKLTAERRAEIARIAAAARWGRR